MSETYDLFQQGREHLQKGRAAQATVALEKAKRREPDKASIREALGIAYFRIQRYAEAESEFRAMLDLSPADDYAHYGLARALEKLGRKDEARGHMKLASSLRPGSEDYAERGARRRRLATPTREAGGLCPTGRLNVRAVVQRVVGGASARWRSSGRSGLGCASCSA